MNLSFRLSVSVLTLIAGLVMGAPAQARTDCASNGNLARVNARLDGAIDRLSQDQRDYGGHKGQAMGDLQNARNELNAAAQWATANDHENPACFAPGGPGDVRDVNRGPRTQGGSNRDLRHVRSWVERMIDQLQRDQHDYDGHRIRAIADMQAARTQLVAAEAWARGHGY